MISVVCHSDYSQHRDSYLKRTPNWWVVCVQSLHHVSHSECKHFNHFTECGIHIMVTYLH